MLNYDEDLDMDTSDDMIVPEDTSADTSATESSDDPFDISEYTAEDTATEGVTFDDDEAYEDSLSPAAEAAILLETLRSECASDEEFVNLVTESAAEMQLYGLIPDADAALEATRVIKVENWKIKERDRLVKRECIRIGYRRKDKNYAMYKKYRDLMRQYRAKLFARYTNEAKRNVLHAQQNARAKASTINTSTGRELTSRINASINKSTKGSNPTSAPNTSRAN